jgi:hypothetical protein
MNYKNHICIIGGGKILKIKKLGFKAKMSLEEGLDRIISKINLKHNKCLTL